MSMRTAAILTEEGSKGRAFQFEVLSEVFVPGVLGDKYRPAFLIYAATDGVAAPVAANLMQGSAYMLGGGKSAEREKRTLMKSRRWIRSSQKVEAGTVVTIADDILFRLDPTTPAADVDFVCMPSHAWLQHTASSTADMTEIMADGRKFLESADEDHYMRRNSVREIDDALEYLASAAPLFCAYLDRRITAPTIRDRRFQLRLLIAAMRRGMATLVNESYVSEHHPSAYGHEPWFGTPILCTTTDARMSQLVAHIATSFIKE